MRFNQAFQLMKQGHKVKLPSWGGYWYWDEEKQTILMHCRPGNSDTGNPIMDIRETQRVEYTMMNICSDQWIIASEKNTPILGGSDTFGFEDAIKYLKRGLKVKRKWWDCKSYLVLEKDIIFEDEKGVRFNCEYDLIGNQAIAYVGYDGVPKLGWIPYQSDMLIEDWIIVE